MDSIVEEGSIRIFGEQKEIVDKKMPVFYNSVMKLNRDISILLLSAFSELDAVRRTSGANKERSFRIADPLAGSGIRSLRFKKELKNDIIKEIHVNDFKPDYKNYLKKNIELNNLIEEDFVIHNEDANLFLGKSTGFDYIDIDPFGSPNPFLDSAIRALHSEGLLAVTATDTSALCGSYPGACRRKYWATPLRNHLMHEFGLRILIRKVQLVGLQYEKALIPIFSYAKEHYMRVFFLNTKSKKLCDDISKKHSFLILEEDIYGPVWTGDLWNDDLIKHMKKESSILDKESLKFFNTIAEESKIKEFGFYDIHKLAKNNLKGNLPKFETIMNFLESEGFKVSRTHFSPTGIKTDAPKDLVEKVLFSK